MAKSALVASAWRWERAWLSAGAELLISPNARVAALVIFPQAAISKGLLGVRRRHAATSGHWKPRSHARTGASSRQSRRRSSTTSPPTPGRPCNSEAQHLTAAHGRCCTL
jgi:hypothetical protein